MSFRKSQGAARTATLLRSLVLAAAFLPCGGALAQEGGADERGAPAAPEEPEAPDARAARDGGAEAAPAENAFAANELVVEVLPRGGEAHRLSYGHAGAEGFRVFALDTENRANLKALVGGVGKTGAIGGKSGFTVLFFLHLYGDGREYLEGQILNDAMAAPPGKVDATWRVTWRGLVAGEGRTLFHDECGVGFQSGRPRFVPRQDLLQRYLETMPAPGSVRGVALDDAEEVADPDPVKNTHQAGSPRNGYHAIAAAKYLLTQDERYLARLMDWVLAQARRPYHLSEMDGEPFLHARHPEAYFLEGKPELLAYRQTFDRLLMPSAQLESGGWNGWDREHANVEELYAAYMLCGSRVARRELVLVAEQLLSTPDARDERKKPHSGRTFGWMTRALVRAYQATGQKHYLDGVRRMMRALNVHRDGQAPYRGLVPQPPQGDHMKDERWESPFMVAVAASGLALYVREEPTDALARELLGFCADLLVEQGYSREPAGFYYDYAVDSNRRSGSPSTKGVATWICAPLVEAAMLAAEGDRAKYLGPARALYDANVADGNATPKSREFYRWFLLPAKVFGTR